MNSVLKRPTDQNFVTFAVDFSQMRAKCWVSVIEWHHCQCYPIDEINRDETDRKQISTLAVDWVCYVDLVHFKPHGLHPHWPDRYGFVGPVTWLDVFAYGRYNQFNATASHVLKVWLRTIRVFQCRTRRYLKWCSMIISTSGLWVTHRQQLIGWEIAIWVVKNGVGCTRFDRGVTKCSAHALTILVVVKAGESSPLFTSLLLVVNEIDGCVFHKRGEDENLRNKNGKRYQNATQLSEACINDD